MPIDTRIQVLIEQVQTILILLERPVVQQQLLALSAIFLLAIGLSRGLSAILPSNVRFRVAIEHLDFPFVAILLSWIVILWFTEEAEPVGLLQNALRLFLIWGGYELGITLLVNYFGSKRVEWYHQRLLAPLFFGFVAALITDNLIDVNLLAQIQLTVIFNTAITLGGVVMSVIVFYLFWVATAIIADVLEQVVMPNTTADVGLINSIQTLSRYVIMMLGLFMATSTLGFDLSTLAFIGGGVTIAIGFGLQQIVANFVSGILLIFEQALRPGDVIKIEGEVGVVEQLRIRSTVVRTRDNVELIIPNEKLLTSTVTSYTKSDRLVRISLEVGVSYDSDPHQVHDILIECAKKHNLVENDPSPLVHFIGLGDSSVNFELLVWIMSPNLMRQVRSDLYFLVWDALAQHQIEIPYPQRDLNLRRGFEALFAQDKLSPPTEPN